MSETLRDYLGEEQEHALIVIFPEHTKDTMLTVLGLSIQTLVSYSNAESMDQSTVPAELGSLDVHEILTSVIEMLPSLESQQQFRETLTTFGWVGLDMIALAQKIDDDEILLM